MGFRPLARRGLDTAAFTFAAAIYLTVVCPLSRVRATWKRLRGERPTIMWGPTPVINIKYSARADRLFGYRSESVAYSVYPINEREDFDVLLDHWTTRRIVGRFTPYGAWVWAGLRYDVFGFFFDGGFLAATRFWRLELPLLKLAGKKIIVYPYGGDARIASRTRALGRWHAYTDVPVGEEDRNEEDVARHVAAFGRWADVMLGNNDLVADLPRTDGVLPFPFDEQEWEPEPTQPRDDEVVTVVHAANHRHYKGTRFVIEAVEQLRAEGLPVELELVEGMPRERAREIYRRADIAAADFLIGGYAYFAIEAMALGKPVLSYLRPDLAPFHPEWRECPIVNASPDTLTEELRRLVGDPVRRRSLGREGPRYVRRQHSLAKVGALMDAVYRRLWLAPGRRYADEEN